MIIQKIPARHRMELTVAEMFHNILYGMYPSILFNFLADKWLILYGLYHIAYMSQTYESIFRFYNLNGAIFLFIFLIGTIGNDLGLLNRANFLVR